MSWLLSEQEGVIYQEMMSHTALFSHPNPQKVAVMSMSQYGDGILAEVLKHESVESVCYISSDVSRDVSRHSDARVQYYKNNKNNSKWIEQNSFDVIILAASVVPEIFSDCFKALSSNGILIQEGGSSFHIDALKNIQKALYQAKFSDVHTLSFPEPSFTSGWHTAFMAKKEGILHQVREKDVFNKKFSTRYYNFDIHKASWVMPEFMREELTV